MTVSVSNSTYLLFRPNVLTFVDEDHFSYSDQCRLSSIEEKISRSIIVDFDGRHFIGIGVNLAAV
jgi:hypothetical protein